MKIENNKIFKIPELTYTLSSYEFHQANSFAHDVLFSQERDERGNYGGVTNFRKNFLLGAMSEIACFNLLSQSYMNISAPGFSIYNNATHNADLVIYEPALIDVSIKATDRKSFVDKSWLFDLTDLKDHPDKKSICCLVKGQTIIIEAILDYKTIWESNLLEDTDVPMRNKKALHAYSLNEIC